MREITAALLRERLARRPPEPARRGLRDGRLPRLGRRHGLVRPSGRRGHQRRGRGAGAGRGSRRRAARGAGARPPVPGRELRRRRAQRRAPARGRARTSMRACASCGGCCGRTESCSCARTAAATRDGSGRTGGSTTPARSKAELEAAGFDVVRITYVNAVLSMWGAARGRGPTAPTPTTCGIPAQAGTAANAVGRTLLGLEARVLRHSRVEPSLRAHAPRGGGAGRERPGVLRHDRGALRPALRRVRTRPAACCGGGWRSPSSCSASHAARCSTWAWAPAACAPSSTGAAGR